MKNRMILGVLFGVIILSISIFILSSQSLTAFNSYGEVVETLKEQYPEFKEYPSEGLPPKSITVEEDTGGWYVAFVQEGSGRPIISAKCFFVDRQKNIRGVREYNPTVEEDSTSKFSPKTCSPGACALENCHGLDIKCGSNPPDVCTAMYALGDKCLQYARCGVQNGTCQQLESPSFTQCKSCVQSCIANNEDAMKLFECESNCK